MGSTSVKPSHPSAIRYSQFLLSLNHRSHRERKERYIRNLEQEVIRLREAYAAVVKEKTSIIEENKQLQAMIKRDETINQSTSRVPEIPTLLSGGIGGIVENKAQYHQDQVYAHHNPAHQLPPPPPPIPLSQPLPSQPLQPPQPSQPLQSDVAYSITRPISTEQYGQAAIDLVLA